MPKFKVFVLREQASLGPAQETTPVPSLDDAEIFAVSCNVGVLEQVLQREVGDVDFKILHDGCIIPKNDFRFLASDETFRLVAVPRLAVEPSLQSSSILSPVPDCQGRGINQNAGEHIPPPLHFACTQKSFEGLQMLLDGFEQKPVAERRRLLDARDEVCFFLAHAR